MLLETEELSAPPSVEKSVSRVFSSPLACVNVLMTGRVGNAT
jgi:hypothetical protein